MFYDGVVKKLQHGSVPTRRSENLDLGIYPSKEGVVWAEALRYVCTCEIVIIGSGLNQNDHLICIYPEYILRSL